MARRRCPAPGTWPVTRSRLRLEARSPGKTRVGAAPGHQCPISVRVRPPVTQIYIPPSFISFLKQSRVLLSPLTLISSSSDLASSKTDTSSSLVNVAVYRPPPPPMPPPLVPRRPDGDRKQSFRSPPTAWLLFPGIGGSVGRENLGKFVGKTLFTNNTLDLVITLLKHDRTKLCGRKCNFF